MMKKSALIQKAYAAFSGFKKPEQCTRHLDFEDAGFNAMLLSATRRSLSTEQAGTAAWGTIASMAPEALAYFMPRLIELAVSGVADRDGDPFYCHFINTFHQYPDSDRYRLFGAAQKEAMADAFDFLCQTFWKQLALEGWLEEARQAAVNWRQ